VRYTPSHGTRYQLQTEVRFGGTPAEMVAMVQRVTERETLHALLRQAITCPTLEAFGEALRVIQ